MISLNDYIPPVDVISNCKKGLRLRQKFNRGGTHIGCSIAEQLISKNYIDPELIRRMVSYFSRHEIDKRAPKFGNDLNPSAGYIAWLLWGGDEGRLWAQNLKNCFPVNTKKRNL
jgi:hypothetical protein